MNNTTEQRYLVFLKAEFLCDAMGYIAGAVPHGTNASLFDDECDGNWRSVSGPVRLMDKTCADMDELKGSILDNYPGIDFEVLDIMAIKG